MSEALSRHSPLASVYQIGRFGLNMQPPGITIQQLNGLSITQIATFPANAERTCQVIQELYGLAPAVQPCQAVIQGTSRILWNGPQCWWLVGPDNPALLQQLRSELDADTAITEHSHGRFVLRLAGSAIRDLLAKGSTVDFHADHFQAGWCRPLALDHFDVLLHCLDNLATADVYIARSLAVSFWEWLLDASGEFGGEVLAIITQQ